MRSVPDWIGKNDDEPAPDRVKLRVWDRANGCCASCKRKILAGEKRDYDHIHALANGGQNCEGNLQLLCSLCHGKKTKIDVGLKTYNYKRRLAHAGIKRRKSRPMPGSRDSGWKVTFGRGVVRRG